MFPLLFHYFLRRTERYFKANRIAKLTTAAIFLGVVLLLMAGIFSFFSHTFRFIALTDYFHDAVLLYLYELFLFAIFLLVFASALITGLFSLFVGKNHVLIAVSPQFSLIPKLVLGRMFIAALWPILIIVFPALLAIARVYTLSFPGALLTLCSLLLFVAFGVISALVLIFLTAAAMLRIRRSLLRFERLAFSILTIATLAFFLLWQPISTLHLNTLFQAEATELTTSNSLSVRERFVLLPSHPAALVLFSAGKNDLPTMIKSTSILGLMVAIVTGLFLILSAEHLRLWQIFQENRSSKTYSLGPLSQLIARSTGPQNALFRHEFVTFFRNTSGMTWFGFFCLIWLLQSGSMFILNHRLTERPETLPFFVIALQVAATIYFVNMFVLRFAFPSFSMEQKVSHIIQAAPINQNALFLGRITFYVPLLALLSTLFTLLNTFILQTSFSGSIIILGSILIASVTVTLSGLALGVLFPNFETADPEILSTSLPGLSFIFTSLLYGSSVALAVRNSFLSHNYLLLASAFLISIIISASATFLAYQRLTPEPKRHQSA